MAKQNFGKRWTPLAAAALVAGGLVVATAPAQDQSDQSGRTSRTAERERSQHREASDRQSRDQSNQDRNTPWLGVWLGRTSGEKNQPGAEVERVFPGSPAERAGLESGDIITAINGEKISSPDDVMSAIEDEKPGTRMKFTVLRDEAQKNMTATLGNRQDMAPSEENRAPWNEPFGGSSAPYGQYGQYGQYGGNHLSPFAMQLEHDRRNFEQHERIENEIARLRQEVHELRDMLQQQLQRR